MSALTTDKTVFNANGVYDPEIYKTGVAIKRKIDFGLANVTGSTNYEYLPLPKGFRLKGLHVKEIEKCGASTTLTVKTASDSATIGSAVNVGGGSLADEYAEAVAAGGPKIVKDGDMLCVVAGADLKEGVVEVTVIGDVYDGDSLNGFGIDVPYRSAGQTAGANASKGDIYLKR